MNNTDKLAIEHAKHFAIMSLVQLAKLALLVFGLYCIGWIG